MVRDPGMDLYLSPENDSLWSGYYIYEEDNKWSNIYTQTQNKMLPFKDYQQIFQLKIIPINEEKLKLQYYKNGLEYKSRKLKGEYRDGYFQFKRIQFFRPLFPIAWGPSRYYGKLGISKEGKLVFQENSIGYFFLVFVPFGKGLGFSDKEYEKKELMHIKLTKKKE